MSAEAETEEGADERAVVFLDASLEPERVEELQQALGRPARAIDPLQIDLETLCEDAAALVVPWDLAGQPGLDLVESLARREAAAGIPIVMVSPEPTRARVLAALRAGATGFALQPYDPEELSARLAPVAEDAPTG